MIAAERRLLLDDWDRRLHDLKISKFRALIAEMSDEHMLDAINPISTEYSPLNSATRLIGRAHNFLFHVDPKTCHKMLVDELVGRRLRAFDDQHDAGPPEEWDDDLRTLFAIQYPEAVPYV